MIPLNYPPGNVSHSHITRAVGSDWVISSGIEKEDLVSGEYSILVLSNNGNADPIAYQRDFSLIVGPQQTTTVSLTHADLRECPNVYLVYPDWSV